jgi:hypothetical protein
LCRRIIRPGQNSLCIFHTHLLDGITKNSSRLGYSLFLVAIVAFAIGFATSFGTGLVNVIVWSMVIGSLVLAPAIVFDYAVKAAVRDDREHGRSLG